MRKARILYVEDDPDIAQIGLLSLRLDDAIEARIATNGFEALHLMRTLGWRPDVLLLDVMMPGMSGLDVMQALARDADLRDIPVILMTARAGPANLREYEEKGVIGVIAKPFDPLRLGDDVLSCLHRHEAAPQRQS
jgi:CheY-like chemotaxis protein